MSVQQRRYFYLIMAFIGTVVPWWFFVQFFSSNGVDLPLFMGSLFANGAAAGFSIDVILSIVVFFVWVYHDARTHQVKRGWWVIPSTFTVGLSLALPLYLYLRSFADINYDATR